VQSQLQNHPDELWEDGVRDYLSHSSHIMVIYLILLTCISLNYTITDLFVNIVLMFPFSSDLSVIRRYSRMWLIGSRQILRNLNRLQNQVPLVRRSLFFVC
jgi:hypothetical protein